MNHVDTPTTPAAVRPEPDPSDPAALQVTRLDVAFGGLHALDGVSFSAPRASVTALIGPNGAGKTTALNAISGLIRSSCSGEIHLLGEQVLGRRPSSIASLGFARSFQDPPLLDKETVLENLLLGAHSRLGYGPLQQLTRPLAVRRAEAAARQRATELADEVGLSGQLGRPAGSLPYGARKLVDIVRALISEPVVLCLDEPTSGLDVNERTVVRDLIMRLRESGTMTIVVVEHHMDLVREVATQAIGLQSGMVIAAGSPAEVLDSTSYQQALVGAVGTATDSGEG